MTTIHSLKPNTPGFFFDDSLIAHQHRLARHWLPARIHPEPVLKPERPWEQRELAYPSIVADPAGGYRLYYTICSITGMRNDSPVCLATSPDGLRWEKPNLGLVEFNGSRANNFVVKTDYHLDGPSVLHDPSDSNAPWKMLLFHIGTPEKTWGDDWGFYSYTSADGLRWKQIPGRRLLTGDRNNLAASKVNGKFVNFTRLAEMYTRFGGRVIYRTESADFIQWSPGELVLAPDLEDAPDVEFYGLSAFERNGWWIGLLEYWDSLNDCIETHLAVSRDTKRWIRTPRKPFIAATHDWNRCWSICASNGPIILNEQMIFYFNGRANAHHWDTAHRGGVIGYASLPLDRFCAIEGTSGGALETIPLQWPGGELVINADSRGEFDRHPLPLQFSGEIHIELLDAAGKPLPDFSGDNKVIWRGNTHCRGAINDGRFIRWPKERKLDSLRNQVIRLRFLIKHARLFTVEASMRP